MTENTQPRTAREVMAEQLFYAARRDDWDAANAGEREEFYSMAEYLLSCTPQPSIEHRMVVVDGEIEVCDTCRNSEGNPIAWGQTWHYQPSSEGRQCPRSETCVKAAHHRGGCYNRATPAQPSTVTGAQDWDRRVEDVRAAYRCENPVAITPGIGDPRLIGHIACGNCPACEAARRSPQPSTFTAGQVTEVVAQTLRALHGESDPHHGVAEGQAIALALEANQVSPTAPDLHVCPYGGLGLYDDGSLPKGRAFDGKCPCGAIVTVLDGRVPFHYRPENDGKSMRTSRVAGPREPNTEGEHDD